MSVIGIAFRVAFVANWFGNDGAENRRTAAISNALVHASGVQRATKAIVARTARAAVVRFYRATRSDDTDCAAAAIAEIVVYDKRRVSAAGASGGTPAARC